MSVPTRRWDEAQVKPRSPGGSRASLSDFSCLLVNSIANTRVVPRSLSSGFGVATSVDCLLNGDDPI